MTGEATAAANQTVWRRLFAAMTRGDLDAVGSEPSAPLRMTPGE